MIVTNQTIPSTQWAVQLVGPGELKLNTDKPVPAPGPRQILARIEAVGLCFSDLKLLKQFDAHVRKSEVIAGLTPEQLAEIPSYVPGKKPTVPGHEAVCEIVAVGPDVQHHRVGERCLIQTDYRSLKTAASVAAFGYNFEGALQEYALMDERVVFDPAQGGRFLIPVGEELSASAVGLVEPWACVEDSYVNEERRTIKAGGKLLVVADNGHTVPDLSRCYAPEGGPKTCFVLSSDATNAAQVDLLKDEAFDDIIYFGSDKATIELLNDKLATRGILCIVLGGRKIGQPVNMGVGRTHYGMTRWIGTQGDDPTDAYAIIPCCGEIRDGDRALIVGAGGPMGQMHVIRDVCSGHTGVEIVGTDFDESRLASLLERAQPLANANGVKLSLVNPKANPPQGRFTYIAIMAPVPQLLADSIGQAGDGALINLFAGIPASVKHEIDLDTYIARKAYIFGTSGSVIRDMKIVLEKVQQNRLDTNMSVDAVCGMAGAIDGMAAVENRTLAGKIIAYPALHELPLIPLAEMGKHYPTVAAKLRNGVWTKEAEDELLRVAT